MEALGRQINAHVIGIKATQNCRFYLECIAAEKLRYRTDGDGTMVVLQTLYIKKTT